MPNGAKAASLDGLVSRYLNRPLSRPAARLLLHTPLTPNQITVASLLIAFGAGCLLFLGDNVWAAVAIHVSSVVDGVDGDLARLRNTSSRFGAIFDAVLDRYADAAIIGGATYWAYRQESYPAAALLGLIALAGAFAVSYSRARIEASAGFAPDGFLLGVGTRDVRLLLLTLGLLAGQAWWTLLLVAVVAHGTVLARLWSLYRRAEVP